MRTVFIILFNVIVIVAAPAQGFYFGGSIGGGTQDKTTHTGYNFQGPQDSEKGNPGKGFISNVAVGYFLGTLVGVELGAGYMTGRETNKTKLVDDSLGLSAMGYSRPAAKTFFLNPAVTLRTDSYSDVVFYMKGGVLIGLTNTCVYEDKYIYRHVGKTDLAIDDKTYYSGKMSYGGNIDFGLDFMLSDKFCLFGEVSYRVTVWKPEKYSNIVIGTHEDGSTEVLTTGEKPARSILFLDAVGLNVGLRYYLFEF